MSTEVLSQTLQAGIKATFGSGSAFVIVNAVSPVTIVARSIGNSNKNRTFTSVPAGFKFTADDPSDGFDTLEVTSAANQVFTIAVGTDDVEFSNAVTVTGGVVTQETPSANISNIAPLNTAITGGAALFPANGARRRITVYSDPTNAGVVYFLDPTGSNHVGFIVPGTFQELDTTAALKYTDAAGGNVLYFLEEA